MIAPGLTTLRALPDEALVPVSWVRELIGSLNGANDEADSAIVPDMTVADVGQHLGRTAACVRGWCRSGKMPGAYRHNGVEWRIPRAALRAYLANARDNHAPSNGQAGVDLGAWRNQS